MTAEGAGGKRRKRRYLPGEERYRVWLEVVTGQGTGREVADRWGVGRSTVMGIVKTAREVVLGGLAVWRPGRSSMTPEQAALEDARAEIARVVGDGHRPGGGVGSVPGGEERWG